MRGQVSEYEGNDQKKKERGRRENDENACETGQEARERQERGTVFYNRKEEVGKIEEYKKEIQRQKKENTGKTLEIFTIPLTLSQHLNPVPALSLSPFTLLLKLFRNRRYRRRYNSSSVRVIGLIQMR